jgi:5S rRNA maturation endonuclease (ribonuclease M5)
MKHNEKIDWKSVKSIIYDHLNLPSAFTIALGFFHPVNRFKNPFRLDKKGDCTFFQDKADSRIWLFHDFALGETWDIFKAYEQSQGTDFLETIRALAELSGCTDKMQNMGLFLDSKQSYEESNLSGSELLKRLKEQKKQQKKEIQGIITEAYEQKKKEQLALQASESWTKAKPEYKYIAHSFGIFMPHHAAVFEKRGLTFAEIKDNVVALQQVYTEKADGTRHIVFTDSPEQPLFLYADGMPPLDMITDFNKYLEFIAQQIYRPYSENKRYKFRNIGSPDILFKNYDKSSQVYKALQNSQSVGDEFYYPWKGVIVTKGYKEALLLKKLMKDYIITGKCGEGSKLDVEFMKDIEAEFGHKDFPIYVWTDNDVEGRKLAKKQEAHFLNMGYTSVFKTFIAEEGTGHKDIDEMVVAAKKSYPDSWENPARIVLEYRIIEAVEAVKNL